MTLPVLYSLRNCPYAMRARLAIYKSKQAIELRDVVLTNKPQAMLTASPKGTVPILVLSSSKVIDESLDVMLWALNESDPENLLLSGSTEILALISRFDDQFKGCLEQYKCAKRYHESNLDECRQACEVYIKDLEQRLNKHDYIIDEKESLADIAVLPFIRQFARVERQWYLQAPYPKVKHWLNRYLQSAMFSKIMAKNPLWSENSAVIVFTGKR